MGAEVINTLFVHSLPADGVSIEIIELLAELKAKGKILTFGYSGDGEDLQELISRHSFDSYQATLNVLDLSNYETILDNKDKNWYIKRPLCNQVFRIHPKLELLEFMQRIRDDVSQNTGSYKFRYQEMFGSRLLNQVRVTKMLSFLLSLRLNASVIVGTRSTKHLKKLCRIAQNPEWWEVEALEQHIETWSRLAEVHEWKALI